MKKMALYLTGLFGFSGLVFAAYFGADRTDPRFPSCAEAEAAGYGTYYAGVDPEYEWYEDTDADADGVVCEGRR